MVLTITKESEAVEKSQMLVRRAEQEVESPALRQGIIELIGTILLYKFTNLSWQEINIMLGDLLQHSRAYREIQEEKAQEIAIKMLQKNTPLEFIVEVTGLSIETIQNLRSQLEQQS
jgi:predicted transposase YdaD